MLGIQEGGAQQGCQSKNITGRGGGGKSYLKKHITAKHVGRTRFHSRKACLDKRGKKEKEKSKSTIGNGGA